MDQFTPPLVTSDHIDLANEADFPLGRLVVRPSRREVNGFGGTQTLQPRVMQVLVALAHPASDVVSHEELIRRCWNGLTVGEDAIRRCIAKLRKLAAQWPEPPFLIETIGGVGYRLDLVSDDSAAAPRANPSAPPMQAPGRRGRVWPIAVPAVLLILVVGAVWLTRQTGLGTAPRVAVLPLEALSTRPEARYLAAGVADEMSRALSASQVEALPRTDAATVQRAAMDPQAAARLGVGLVLNGSVQDVKNDTLVNVRLEDAQTHVSLWSGDFRRPSSDAGALREEVAAKVADIVGIAEFARENPRVRADDDTLSAVLHAHDLVRWNRRGSWGQLLALTQQASAREPDFAFGHAMVALADAYAIRWGAPAQQWPTLTANARSEAARAIALDPREASPYFVLSILAPGYQAKEAVLLKGLATATHPAAPLAALYNSEGEVLLSVGRLYDALPYFQRSYGLDSLSAVKAASLVQAYAMVGDIGAAEELIGQALIRWPDHPGLRAARLHLATFYGSPTEARALLATPAQLPPDLSPEALAIWQSFVKAQPKDDKHVAHLVAQGGADGALRLQTAVLMLAKLNDLDDAFALAGRIADLADPSAAFLFEPIAAPMRRDRRFMRLATRFGLPAYWRSTGHWPDICTGRAVELDCPKALAWAEN